MKKAGFKILENEWIPLADGRKLAARIWMPNNADKKPLPAILEYLPYRKRDGTAQRDDSTYPAFARAGISVSASTLPAPVNPTVNGMMNIHPENWLTVVKSSNGLPVNHGVMAISV